MAKEKPVNVPVSTSENKSPVSVFHPLSEMERAFERFFNRNWPSFMSRSDFPAFDSLVDFERQRMPNLDVVDQDNEIVVRAEIPGIDKKDVSISLTDNLLTIKGETQKEKKDDKGNYHRREISRSSFARTVTLPSSVDASKSVASLKDGVLEIKLPKAESSRRRSIAVQ
jgi:HSP20 family protein